MPKIKLCFMAQTDHVAHVAIFPSVGSCVLDTNGWLENNTRILHLSSSMQDEKLQKLSIFGLATILFEVSFLQESRPLKISVCVKN